ncbi:cytochrome b562 [Pseudoalteromonas mariniglutinosa]|uniref:cytochrome b562 n=1 Tax=Pseudoalteromonas mariniglutinosa TaxID=206042 RepID=UPI00384F3B31
MKFIFLLSVLLTSGVVFAAQPLDLEATMKEMGLAYKQTVQAGELTEFNSAIDEFITLLKKTQAADFKNHQAESAQGIKKVIVKAQLAKRLANEQGLDAAVGPLKAIDGLRKQYHELHEPPGFWQLLFGK